MEARYGESMPCHGQNEEDFDEFDAATPDDYDLAQLPVTELETRDVLMQVLYVGKAVMKGMIWRI